MENPEVQKWAQKAKAVVSQVLVDNHCGPASWVGGRVGGVISTIDPIKAPRLKLPLTGVWVEKSLPGGSLEKAGILRGDTIVAVNDIPVADASEFFVILLKQPIGSTIRVKFWRVRTFMELPVVVAAPAA
ncbi:PDZ domain-containing protein [Pseudomonas ogarae]|uniref:PDZ domain-containing protein n=2 Tax=Pseudomonas ogarae (strain DSM 112162 / CECT 30235 / F113) TaxID=1114970 RepID=A0ABN5GER7_PSEO1|nr:PDZ domain-containing protein [Pseudomonas ogarae]